MTGVARPRLQFAEGLPAPATSTGGSGIPAGTGTFTSTQKGTIGTAVLKPGW